MKIINSKKKFIYLISPNKINKIFFKKLKKVLSLNKTAFFQLRMKNLSKKRKINIARKVKRICESFKVKFIINDDPVLAKQVKADGCHLGQKDMSILKARKILGRRIIGITCHNSIRLAKVAINNKADYLAFGAFYLSKTKKTNYRADVKILNKAKKLTKLPIVAIGGINNENYKKLLLNKANFLAISSYVWENKKLKPVDAIKKLK